MQALGGQNAWTCWGPAEHVADAEMSWQSWVGLRARPWLAVLRSLESMPWTAGREGVIEGL